MQNKIVRFKLKSDKSYWVIEWWRAKFGKNWYTKTYEGKLLDSITIILNIYNREIYMKSITIIPKRRTCFKENDG